MSIVRPSTVVPKVSKSVLVGAASLLVLLSIGTYMVVHPGQVAQPIQTSTVRYGTLYPYLSATGTIGSDQTVDVSSSVGGQIVKWLVQEGSVVRAGQPLAYFSNYVSNAQIVHVLQDRLLQLGLIAADAKTMARLDEQHAEPRATLWIDRAAVHLSFAQYQAAIQQEKDARNQLLLAMRVPNQQRTAAQEQIVKAQTTVALNHALLEQAQNKWQEDKAIIASSGTLSLDRAAVVVAQHQVTAAQALVKAAQDQVGATKDAVAQAKQQAILSARQVLDQATSAVTIDQDVVGEAFAKLVADESPQASATTLAQDEANVMVLQQQFIAAQEKLQTDGTPQATPDTLAQDQSTINVLGAQVAAAEQKLLADNGPQATQAILLQDQSSVSVLQQQLSAAQSKLTLDLSPPVSKETIQADQANLSVLQQQWAGASAQLTTDTSSGASASILQADQTTSSVLKQEVANAQAQLTVDESPPASLSQIQSDQANVSVLQQQLTSAQNQLKLDQTQVAVPQTLAQDQANLSVLQQQLSGAVNQLHIDQTQTAQPSVITQAQSNIAILQQQLQAAQTQLQLDKKQTAPLYIIQEDAAALKVAQAQEQAAQLAEKDAETAMQQVSSSVSNATVASAQSSLSQALGNAQVNRALVNQADVKWTVDQQDHQSSALIQEDAVAVQVARDQWQEAEALAGSAFQNARASEHPTRAQVLSAQINVDQMQGEMNVDKETWQSALVRLSADVAPTGLRGMLVATQSVAQAQEAVDEGHLDLLNALVTLRHSELTAPVAGQVVGIHLAAGSRLFPEQNALTLYPAHQDTQVVALVDAAQIDEVSSGALVTYQSANFPGTYRGLVQFVSPIPTSQAQGSGYQYPVYIIPITLPKGVSSGMFVSVRIDTPPSRHVVVVSTQALMTQGGQLGVYVQSQPQHFTFHAVTVEQSDDQLVQVSGLRVGAIVALTRPS